MSTHTARKKQKILQPCKLYYIFYRSAEPIKRHPYFYDMNWERLEAGLIDPPFIPNKNQVYAKDVSDIK